MCGAVRSTVLDKRTNSGLPQCDQSDSDDPWSWSAMWLCDANPTGINCLYPEGVVQNAWCTKHSNFYIKFTHWQFNVKRFALANENGQFVTELTFLRVIVVVCWSTYRDGKQVVLGTAILSNANWSLKSCGTQRTINWDQICGGRFSLVTPTPLCPAARAASSNEARRIYFVKILGTVSWITLLESWIRVPLTQQIVYPLWA